LLALLHKHIPGIILALAGLAGLSLANLAMTGLSFTLAPPLAPPPAPARTASVAARPPALLDFEVILQRNLFDSTGPGRETLVGVGGTEAGPAVRARQDLTLVGTVADGSQALAVIMAGREVKVLRPGEDLPGGGTLGQVRRQEIELRYADGSTQTLRLPRNGTGAADPAASAPAASSSAAAGSTDFQVRSVGENRFVIARAEVEKARSNVGELLKQARLEPSMANGQTVGFVVKMIRPNSLLGQLGLRLGDVVTRVNGVELNSPEKALQIFQQLREARRLTIDLNRGEDPVTLEYEVN
jgi:general secretion pathway protein C